MLVLETSLLLASLDQDAPHSQTRHVWSHTYEVHSTRAKALSRLSSSNNVVKTCLVIMNHTFSLPGTCGIGGSSFTPKPKETKVLILMVTNVVSHVYLLPRLSLFINEIVANKSLNYSTSKKSFLIWQLMSMRTQFYVLFIVHIHINLEIASHP